MSGSDDFVTCWFANQTFKIVQRTKIFHSLIIHSTIEVTHEYKAIIYFAIFIILGDSKFCFYADSKSH